jgi:uncharacterized protein
MRARWPTIVVAVIIPGAVLAGPLEDGRGAAARGDFAEAVRLLERAAEGGSADAETDLGLLYERGSNGTPDFEEARMWYLRAAAAGSLAAEANLAGMYAAGRGVPQDDAEAARLYAQAADQGYPLAEADLARLYLDGRSVPRDLFMAYMWATLALDFDRGIAAAADIRDAAAKDMTMQDIQDANYRAFRMSNEITFRRLFPGAE